MLVANISYGQQNTQHNVLAMVSKKKSRGKARRAAKAAKTAADEEVQQSDEPEHESPPQLQLKAEEEEDEKNDHYEDHDEKHDQDNDHDDEEEDHDDSLQIQEITPTVTIDEATGEACLSFCLAVVNGQWTPLKKNKKMEEEMRLAVEEQRQLMNEKIKCIAEKCDHGYHLPVDSICQEFLQAFQGACSECYDPERSLKAIRNTFNAGVDATSKKYDEVWTDINRMERIKSFYMNRGVRSIFDGDGGNKCGYAVMYASFAFYFEQHIATHLLKTQAAIDWPALGDLFSCDDLTILSFFKDRIPCSCLNEKYKEAKSSFVEFGEDEEEEDDKEEEAVDAQIELNYSAIQQDLKSLAMDGEEMALVESTFETDMLSQYALPDLYVPHTQIDAATRETECMHVKLSQLALPSDKLRNVHQFINRFVCEYNNASSVLNYNIRKAYHATREEYADMWNNAAVMERVSVYFLTEGTKYVLEGNNKAASHYASLAYCFEQHIACNLRKERLTMSWPKMNELYFDPDEHTLVSFFKKRISCSCLDSKYKEVKSLKKLGICYNSNCPHPGRKVERRLTKCCSLCRRVNYCSRLCQVENWNVHRLHCPRYVERDVAAMNLD